MKLLYVPFFLQAAFMFIDEKFHLKRGLGLWERFGHPLDSITVFVPMSFIAFNLYSPENAKVFFILAFFSCVFITKDEWVHRKECSSIEQWLHAVLFILHPLIFICSYLIWRVHPDSLFIALQPVFIGLFMLYQVFTWSLSWKEVPK